MCTRVYVEVCCLYMQGCSIYFLQGLDLFFMKAVCEEPCT